MYLSLRFRDVSLLLPLLACASHSAFTQRPTPTRSCEGSPTVDGSREACLLPPWVPGEGESLPNGVALRQVSAREWRVELPGDVPDREAMPLLLGRLREGGLTFLQYGLYCDDDVCLQYAIDLCSATVTETAEAILAAIAADPELPEPGGELSLQLAGLEGPRCDADDPGCEPLPFDSATYDPDASRSGRFHFGGVTGGQCTRDGECLIVGCGNRCHHWSCPSANEASTCEGYVVDRPTFCGCVEGRCGWFQQ